MWGKSYHLIKSYLFYHQLYVNIDYVVSSWEALLLVFYKALYYTGVVIMSYAGDMAIFYNAKS